ncbi:hypothetical protein C453_10325 [Haloferax elongans ATCC BAA-1513]|uniref:Uncharacterized protein n=1 Tax=Haloferax elongans ATCC BAA-1513 TaxID=1230453 RepID=M0HPW1_HALEO|nr:hypothetical protein C453_10325 [Haloferax elongans ATCC BAA-1513]
MNHVDVRPIDESCFSEPSFFGESESFEEGARPLVEVEHAGVNAVAIDVAEDVFDEATDGLRSVPLSVILG